MTTTLNEFEVLHSVSAVQDKIEVEVRLVIQRTDDSSDPPKVEIISSIPWNCTFALHENTDTHEMEQPDLSIPLGVNRTVTLTQEQIASARALAGWG